MEMLLFPAFTFGLEEGPPAAVARAAGLVEETAQHHGIRFPVQGIFAHDHVGLPLLHRDARRVVSEPPGPAGLTGLARHEWETAFAA